MAGALQADVQLNKEVYFPGDEIEVTALAVGLTDSAWVGVIPTTVPHGKEADNDAADLGYMHLKEASRVYLIAPKEPGEYDVRLNDSDEDGKELASRTFKVEADPNPVESAAILWKPEGKLEPGSAVEIPFEAPIGYPRHAWIGIVPSKVPHGLEFDADPVNLGYEYLKSRSRGKADLKLPVEPGEYDVRMFDSDESGDEVASVSFRI